MGQYDTENLTTFRPGRTQRSIAAGAALFALVAAAAVIPVARVPLEPVPAFLPAFVTAVFATDLITAFLLFRQAVVGRTPSLAVLACAYLYTSAIVIPHLWSFPGAIAAGGLFAPFPSTTVYLWAFWHAGWPLMILASLTVMRLERRWRTRTVREMGLLSLRLGLATLGLVAAVTLIAYRGAGHLPVLVVKGSYNALNTTGIGPFVALCVVAATIVVVRVTRLRGIAHLWLVVALAASLADVGLTLFGSARFTVGWYVARLDSILAATFVLGAILHEAGRLSTILATSDRRLRSIVDGVADALLTVTHDDRVASINPAGARLFGIDRTAVTGSPVTDLVPDFVARVKSHRGAVAIEATGRHRSGREFPIELDFCADTDAGRIVIARDVTQRHRAEAAIREARDRAVEAASAKSTFLATMSHELRTPINAIVGNAELMLQTGLDAEGREYASTIRDSADALLGVINDILDFSKIEAGKLEIASTSFSPGTIVEAASDIIATAARKRGLALATYVAPDVPTTTLGDPDRIRQVILNLLSNAVKFTESGSVVVRALVDGVEGDRTIVRFEVSDTGAGIPETTLERLFVPFRQAEAGRRFGGTGLGLSICKRLVELMGGTIGVSSVVGTGSTFWFSIPFVRVDDPAGAAFESPLRNARLLLLETEPVSRQIIAQYLLSWGAIATPASNDTIGFELLRAADKRGAPFAAVIAAEDGAGIDGFALLKRMRADARLAAIPLVLLAANDEPGRASDALRRGAGGYLRKPIHQSAFHDLLAGAIGGGAVPPPAAAPPPDDTTVFAWSGPPPRVLLAEDNPVNRRLASRQFERLGLAIDLVEDGRAAVDAAAATSYDLIFMDCQMPEMDGFEATAAIRAAEAGTSRHVAIVAMTANALEGDREACLAAGMDDYLAKPVQLAALRATLARHLGGMTVAK